MGRLTATATDNNCAGIGGGSKRGGSAGGDITIHGGRIDAKGARFGAGIGSGSAMGTDGSTTIYGGIVTAEGDSDGYGAGIGCAYYGNCGTVTIRGGSVTAQAGTDDSYGAGIGDGCYADGGGTIIISGGTVNAKGGTSCGAVIGSKKGTVTISGGIVTTTCTSPNVGGIGGKDSTLTISGGTVTATGKKGIDCGSFSTTEQGNAVIITESFIPQVDESSLSGVIIVDWRGQVYGTEIRIWPSRRAAPSPSETMLLPSMRAPFTSMARLMGRSPTRTAASSWRSPAPPYSFRILTAPLQRWLTATAFL